jgi:uracil-DNA glycosylase
LYRDADQTVFGTGPQSAPVVLVGEAPGDQEDRAGRPFVGPAGRVLAKALASAEYDPAELYVTNAVKHFKFSRAAGSKRRIHQTPSRTEVVACRPWLFAELAAVQPDVIVLLGATAAKSLLGNDFRLTAHHGEVLRLPVGSPIDELTDGPEVVTTVHPSAVLRGPSDARDERFAQLVTGLQLAVRLVKSTHPPPQRRG